MIKPNFETMTFTALSDWVHAHNVVNGEMVHDSDMQDIEDMHESGDESQAHDEYVSIAHDIWDAMQDAALM